MDVRDFKKGKGTTPPTAVTPDLGEERRVTGEPDDTVGDMVITQFLAFLDERGVSRDDVMKLLASILSSGTAGWSFRLFDRIPVTFAMRRAWVSDYVIREIDKLYKAADGGVSMARVNFQVGLLNLSGSLVNYGDQVFSPETEEGLAAARAFLEKLPYAVQGALVRHLALFDRAVAVATSDWAVKNFTEPRKAE
jgi:hypothetical protein